MTARQCPGSAFDDTFSAVGKAIFVILQGFITDLAGEDVDECHRVVLVAHGERIDDLRNNLGSEFLQALDQFLCGGGRRIALGDELADELVGAETAQQAHGGVPVLCLSAARREPEMRCSTRGLLTFSIHACKSCSA